MKSLGGMTRPKDEMGSQIVSSEPDISHPILVFLSRNSNSQAQARRFPSSGSSAAWISSHFRIQVGSADECVAPGRRQPWETRWTSDGRLSSPETNLKVGLLPLLFMQLLLSHMFLSFMVRTSPLTETPKLLLSTSSVKTRNRIYTLYFLSPSWSHRVLLFVAPRTSILPHFKKRYWFFFVVTFDVPTSVCLYGGDVIRSFMNLESAKFCVQQNTYTSCQRLLLTAEEVPSKQSPEMVNFALRNAAEYHPGVYRHSHWHLERWEISRNQHGQRKPPVSKGCDRLMYELRYLHPHQPREPDIRRGQASHTSECLSARLVRGSERSETLLAVQMARHSVESDRCRPIFPLAKRAEEISLLH